jgi:pimeloyl-ACP methyl ester carboxylesterase
MTSPTPFVLNCVVKSPHVATRPELLFVLIHGLTSAAATFDPVGQAIADQSGSVVVAVDLRGHGSSPEPAHLLDYGIDDMAADVLHTLAVNGLMALPTSAALAAAPAAPAAAATATTESTATTASTATSHHPNNTIKTRRLVVLGHSYGSKVALRIAAIAPHLIAAVLVEDMTIAARDSRPAARALDEDGVLAEATARKAQWPQVLAFPSHQAVDDWYRAVCRTDKGKHDYTRKIGERRIAPPPTATAATSAPPSSDAAAPAETTIYYPLFKPHVSLVWGNICACTGQNDVWSESKKFKFPVHIIAADREGAIGKNTFRELLSQAQRITATGGAPRTVVKILNSGHSIHRTHPAEFIAAVVELTATAV